MNAKETGLPFQDSLVRAILDGSKVRTRRIVDHPPLTVEVCDDWFENDRGGMSSRQLEGYKPMRWYTFDDETNAKIDWLRQYKTPYRKSLNRIRWNKGKKWALSEACCSCPYGFVGDRIWVREAWRIGAWQERWNDYGDGASEFAIDYRSSPELTKTPWIEIKEEDECNKWRDRLLKELQAKGIPEPYRWEPGQAPLAWHPSIHMPRWACRTVLPITSLSLERVQDITEQEALEEGMSNGDQFETARDEFRFVWDSIYEAQGLGWLKNPWVWNIGWKVQP